MKIKELFDKVRVEEGKKIYYDSARRHHKTDGIIFQPNTAYKFGSDSELIKWKPADFCSVDLQVYLPQSGAVRGGLLPHLLCSGPEGVRIDCTKRGQEYVGLGYFDSMRLLADADDFERSISRGNSTSRRNVIAEVAYDTRVGSWTYFHIRKVSYLYIPV